ncbi:histidine phosphatase family protein [Ornithinimicrobium sediminis]|uniref:histidine phosphatase family protein n=1 Tax=Ornithinimicrobium sediminis TaxID=2904603 RepID=UPI001E5141A2|nr:histidine phosphatase family protein [Ornithinimicrobium sediminis]
MQKWVYLVRHGQALKNVADRHGGPGTGLTGRGYDQARAVARYMATAGRIDDRGELIGDTVPQVRETVSAISAENQWDVRFDERLRGTHLGVLADLSREDAASHHPGAANRLEEWRNGLRRIDELQIPEAEPVEEFRARVKSALGDLLQSSRTHTIIVATNSTLIMIQNILMLGRGFDYELYRPHTFPNGSITAWIVASESFPEDVSLIVDRYVPDEWP